MNGDQPAKVKGGFIANREAPNGGEPVIYLENGVIFCYLVESRKLKGWKSWPVEDIVRIEAYDRDFVTIDQINLFFQFRDGTNLNISEDMQGWGSFMEGLKQAIGSDMQPLETLNQNPFSKETLVIYERTDKQ